MGLPRPSSTPSMKALRSMACMIARRTRTSFSGGFLLLMARMPLPAVLADLDREALVGLELLQALRRDATRHAVDVAGQQRRDLRRRVADEAEGHLVDLDRARVAVAGPLDQRDRLALLPAVEACRGRCRPAWWRWWPRSSGSGSRPCSRPGGRASSRRRCSAPGSRCAGRARRCWRCCRTPPSWPCWCEPSALARSKLNFTAAASKGSPSWNLMPFFSLKV